MKKLMTLLLAFAATVALAQQGNQGYLVDSNNNIVKSGTGLCWHTGYWTPAMAVEGCDPIPANGVVSAKVSMSADTLFDFNRATIKPEGRAMLDRLAADVGQLKLDLVLVYGYTDRIGSDSYNLKLSQQRATAVQKYLQSRGVKADIIAEGRGKAKPVTGDTCKGSKVTNKLIECLAPDRRAVVEIIGTK